MPPYAWLETTPIDFDQLERSMKAMKTLGVPYTQAQVDGAVEEAKRQAKVITDALILEVDPNDTLTEAERLVYEDLQNTEMISLIAYLLRLGTDLNKPVPEEAAEEGGQ